jgi:hypothetical protein
MGRNHNVLSPGVNCPAYATPTQTGITSVLQATFQWHDVSVMESHCSRVGILDGMEWQRLIARCFALACLKPYLTV